MADVPYHVLEALLAFVHEPGEPTWQRLWSWYQETGLAVGNDEAYLQIDDLFDDGEVEAARDLLMDSLPTMLLSPRAHYAAATLAEAFGETEAAAAERHLAGLLLSAMLATGDGSKAAPFVVSRVSDEYDILAALNKQMERQILTADRTRDVLRCTDGSEVWFDIRSFIDRYVEEEATPDGE